MVLATGVTVGAGTGFLVGRATSTATLTTPPTISVTIPAGGSSSTEFSESPGISQSKGRISAASIKKDWKWHPFTGPYTADRWMKFRRTLLGIPTEEISGALEHLATLPASLERFELERELLTQWAVFYPREALDFARAIDHSRHRIDATEEVLRAFATKDPLAAFQWLEAQRDKIAADEYNQLFDNALRGYADKSLEAAIDHFGTWSDSLDRRQSYAAVDALMESLVQQGLIAEAPTYLNKFPEGPLRNQAARQLVSELARVDIPSAIFMIEQLGELGNADDLQRTLIREWSRSDPAGAASYLTDNEDTLSDFSTLASEVVRRWDDVTEASKWLSQYEPSPDLDRATLMLVYRAGDEDPAGAFTWAQSVNDQGLRNRALRVVASNWKAKDDAGFSNFISQDQGLSEEELQLMQSAPARSSESGWGRWGR